MTEHIPAIDHQAVLIWQHAHHGAADLPAIDGVVCVIGYCDAQGRDTNRLITCKRLEVRSGQLMLIAYCHSRKALRHFRVDRILEVIEPATEALFYPAISFFVQFRVDRTGTGITGGWAALVFALRAFLARIFR